MENAISQGVRLSTALPGWTWRKMLCMRDGYRGLTWKGVEESSQGGRGTAE